MNNTNILLKHNTKTRLTQNNLIDFSELTIQQSQFGILKVCFVKKCGKNSEKILYILFNNEIKVRVKVR